VPRSRMETIPVVRKGTSEIRRERVHECLRLGFISGRVNIGWPPPSPESRSRGNTMRVCQSLVDAQRGDNDRLS
jgi:hypothetical protein